MLLRVPQKQCAQPLPIADGLSAGTGRRIPDLTMGLIEKPFRIVIKRFTEQIGCIIEIETTLGTHSWAQSPDSPHITDEIGILDHFWLFRG
ncbi:hypothetical protein DKG74_06030 [Zavarzinia aquatilis]|uniref:Uncharacterized protein n=1 Tax=Zavarzinia aquatilis TaxID=2211142 RepID=A0A317EE53_9PROT|nr:hypothetical protein DKG74_06030 [Zavarzinia aquatilis]